jgi:hypothetical protein
MITLPGLGRSNKMPSLALAVCSCACVCQHENNARHSRASLRFLTSSTVALDGRDGGGVSSASPRDAASACTGLGTGFSDRAVRSPGARVNRHKFSKVSSTVAS